MNFPGFLYWHTVANPVFAGVSMNLVKKITGVFSPRAQSVSTKSRALAAQPSCTWIDQSQIWTKTISGVTFELQLQWQEWTCLPKKARNVQWVFTTRPALNVGDLNPGQNWSRSVFSCTPVGGSPIQINTTNFQTPPSPWQVTNFQDNGEPQIVAFGSTEVSAFSIQQDYSLLIYNPLSSTQWDTSNGLSDFSWP